MTISTLLVDDEELVRQGLRARLAATRDFTVVGECSSGGAAIEAIARLAPDLIFLDVHMPDASGFDVLKAIEAPTIPRIIFVTAFDRYALRAFDVNAIDYLLKPFDDERFAIALRYARATFSSDRTRAIVCTQAGPDACWGTGPTFRADRLAVRTADRIVLLRISEIDWVEASGDYVSLHVGKKVWLMRTTIGAIDRRLAAHGFARIHRSTLVNVDRVRELRALACGEFAVLLHDGTEVKLSRGYRQSLDQVAGGIL
jgi:two-component system, LytTR family, response regulator